MNIFLILIVIFLIILLLFFQIIEENKIIKYFEQNEVDLEYQMEIIRQYELTLINFNWLPSYRGNYRGLFLENIFYLKSYPEQIVLSYKSSEIILKKSDIHIINDMFSGKLLKIKIANNTLRFKLPNDSQLFIYKNL